MTLKNRAAFFSLLMIWLAGCSAPVRPAASTPTQEIAPFKMPPTWTPTVTFTPPPGATAILVETFTPVPPITIPPMDTQTADPNDRWENYIPLPSPSGEWIAYHNVREIKIFNPTTERVWTLPCELFEKCQYILPEKWSQNGDVLFFGASSYLGGVPQDTQISFYSTAGRIDVKTGEWDRLFPDPTGYFDFSISSDDSHVAYTQAVQKEQTDPQSVLLTVLNLNDHREHSYGLGTGFGGNIVWSPYKDRFVFQIRDPEAGSSILYYDADAEVLRTILKERKKEYSIQSWQEDNLIHLQQADWGEQNYSPWHLNPFTNEFSTFPAETAKP